MHKKNQVFFNKAQGCDARCNVLGSPNSKRLPWFGHQLHFDVVLVSNRTHNVQGFHSSRFRYHYLVLYSLMSLSVSQICSAYILVYLLVLSLPEPKCHNRVSKSKYNSLQNLRTDGVSFHKSCFRCFHCKSTLQVSLFLPPSNTLSMNMNDCLTITWIVYVDVFICLLFLFLLMFFFVLVKFFLKNS
ncbi:PREDICTED: uncharacterized protein LOC106339065 [Brassica oleracea var. oleracea]|uniref:uncharacterized protein LOC106339065 n=1 Tax=Brassica oleracea var. oleracea TaxID=109376 RepID=UPI0006A72F55|nr:PREDICTED: uncharacterized protein LOC106339065 [Brassica oleracea var. oleracea]